MTDRHGSAIDEHALGRLCSLDDPTRRRLYEFVTSQSEPVTRDAAATALGIERATAAYHLDKLLEEDLLAASFARTAGRGGPGAGRPAKRYVRVQDEISVSLPPRDYRLAAEILVRAAESDTSGIVREAVTEAAGAIGRELATADGGTSDLLTFLRAQGFEPYADGKVIRLRNCPFHALAQQHTELVCGMNRTLLDAAAGALQPGTVAELDPAPGRCCVAFAYGRPPHREGG